MEIIIETLLDLIKKKSHQLAKKKGNKMNNLQYQQISWQLWLKMASFKWHIF